MTEVKVVEIDGQTAILLPPEAAAHLNARPGGVLAIVQSVEGAWLVADKEVALQVTGGVRAMDKFDEAFRILSK
ncbi:MAG: hypothetical protein ACKO1J_11280 [Tagaea sp.]